MELLICHSFLKLSHLVTASFAKVRRFSTGLRKLDNAFPSYVMSLLNIGHIGQQLLLLLAEFLTSHALQLLSKNIVKES